MSDVRTPMVWSKLASGLACAGLGTVLVLQPFESTSLLLTVAGAGAFLLGGARLFVGWRIGRHWPTLVSGVVWTAVALVLALWPEITPTVAALAVGLALIVSGMRDLLDGMRGAGDERLASVLGGAASIIFGVVALTWPGVTLLLVALLVGIRLIVFGLGTVLSALLGRAPPGGDGSVGSRGPRHRRRHLAGTAAALTIALALAALSDSWRGASPLVDMFYAPPEIVTDEPGTLLRSEPFSRQIPEGAQAWRILYTTVGSDDSPALASALVVVPTAVADAPVPVIGLAHGTTGVARACAPSLLPDPFVAGAFFVLDRVIEEGWAVVATDYVGLGTDGGHPYLVGPPTARSVLDALRAARNLAGANLASRHVVWGHSQGGGAALWTGGLAPTYAPDIELAGVAALAPASDLVGLADNLDVVTAGSIFSSYLLRGYANAYEDVDVGDYLLPTARASFDAVTGRCLAEPSVLLSALGGVTVGNAVFSTDLASGPLLQRLSENVPTLRVGAPLLLAQGDADPLVLPAVQAAYVAERCAAGQAIDFRVYPGLSHVDLVEEDSPLIPDLFEWTRERFSGAPAESNCPSGE